MFGYCVLKTISPYKMNSSSDEEMIKLFVRYAMRGCCGARESIPLELS